MRRRGVNDEATGQGQRHSRSRNDSSIIWGGWGVGEDNKKRERVGIEMSEREGGGCWGLQGNQNCYCRASDEGGINADRKGQH